MEMIHRARRLRRSPVLRKMVRETRMDKSSLIYPMFVMEGTNIKQEIPTMPGQYRYSVDRLPEALEEVADAGVSSVMLFGIPDHKDACGSGAWAEDGIIQKAFRKAKEAVPELYLIGDVCMCEYTDHGHCGILDGEYVDNDKTLEYLAKIALSQVQAGADMVAPSYMLWTAGWRQSAINWMRTDTAPYPLCPMRRNMRPDFMDRFGTRRTLRRRSATGKHIRWIITTGKRP